MVKEWTSDMSDKYSWESLYESGNFSHWEAIYPSPELAALVAAGSIRKNARILDVGCGGGLDAIFMAKCGFEVIGVDFSRSALRVAERRANEANVEINWCYGNVLELPVESESIDFVTDRGLFHVIEGADRPKYASELFRVLKLHGSALVRGASKEASAQNRFYPITEEIVDQYFPEPRFKRGPVLPIPLLSPEGALDSRIVMLRKMAK